ncbi:Cellulose synthase [Dillenia turbinata]|uniref:Cellulose synthase n=1 Tax=Dillenia turbinata TaxID=194707 RepID=A0AAN8VD78_9MAGN
MAKDGYLPLFETRAAKGRALYRLYVVSMLVGLCLLSMYRVNHCPGDAEPGRWAWIGIFMAEFWYSLYWIITQSVRWNPLYHTTFKDRLSQRCENAFPCIDIFVCTADSIVEPPIMVINTVLSVMAYDYPSEKLSIYLSDDGGSILTFYALLEASRFATHWVPFCKKFKVEPRAPAAYFRSTADPLHDPLQAREWSSIKKLYEDMEMRIATAVKLGRLSEETYKQHKGFHEWNHVSSKCDHPTILQILVDGRDPNAIDADGQPLPTLVYLAREKRPQYHHNFKAGAMNALIRVSSKISNAPIILNVDCDMYSNNSGSVKDALCFFMDEKKGPAIAYVQHPQNFENLTANDIYGSALRVIMEVEIAGIGGDRGPCYIGTGCFHRREVLCGNKCDKNSDLDWNTLYVRKLEEKANVLEETSKILASCSYEEQTLWGKEMGLKYGCPVEDIITGLAIQCRGWKSICFIPARKGFLGLAPTTLLQTLVQHKRWSEGDFQIFLSKYCPFLYGRRLIPFQLQLSYSTYLLWAPNSLATLYYVFIPSICLLRQSPLFPNVASPWALLCLGVLSVKYAYSLLEFLTCGGTIQGWWNDQRMWLFKRTTSYLFGFIDSILKQLGFAQSEFVITAKVADDFVSQRYKQEIMEFGAVSPMFTILATVAMFNLFSFIWVLRLMLLDFEIQILESLGLQVLLCGLLVFINFPVYRGLFFRRDSGSIPKSVTTKSTLLAVLIFTLALY